MQIVIDITEEAYNLLQNEGVDWLGAEHILDRVANGKPLTKVIEDIKAEIKEVGYCKDEYGDIRADVLNVGQVIKIIDKHVSNMKEGKENGIN